LASPINILSELFWKIGLLSDIKRGLGRGKEMAKGERALQINGNLHEEKGGGNTERIVKL